MKASKFLNYSSINFQQLLDDHLKIRKEETNSKIEVVVKSIIDDIKRFGDDKIIEFAKNIDKISLSENEIKIPDLKNFYSLDTLNKETVASFKKAINNVKSFHEKQLPNDYNVIIENYAEGFGGGVYSESNGTIDIINCTIVNNNAINSGGGISSWSNDTILNSIVYFNYSSIDSSINGNNNQALNFLFSNIKLNNLN